MGKEYAKVLNSLNRDYIAVGRSEQSAAAFETMYGHEVVRGGLKAFLDSKPVLPEAAVVAVNIEELVPTTLLLLDYGVKKILLEKPGIGSLNEMEILSRRVEQEKAVVLLAYNRRFYSSVLKAEEIIREDGGVSSFNFEFTEWTHSLDTARFSDVALSHWLLGNSSHVIDTAFFLGGQPVEMCSFRAGEGRLPWHPLASVFAGAGRTGDGALFSYSAGWQSPGRWVIEVLTLKHRLYFKPMETLQIQDIGSVAVRPVEVDNHRDIEFKPGFYLQVKMFVEGDYSRFCSIAEQKEHIEHYYLKMSGYTI